MTDIETRVSDALTRRAERPVEVERLRTNAVRRATTIRRRRLAVATGTMMIAVLGVIGLIGLPGAAPPQTTLPLQTAAPSIDPSALECGTFVATQTEHLPDSMVRCFIDAVNAGRPVILKETKITAEGDPIPVTYIANADGRVEVTIDSRQDNYGPKVITRQACTGPTASEAGLTFTQCSDLPN